MDDKNKLINCLVNDGIGLMDEVEFIKNKGHSSGRYTKRDILVDMDLIKLTIKQIENEKRILNHIEFLCNSIKSMDLQILDTLKVEE